MIIPARLQITVATDRRTSPRRQVRLGTSLQTTGEDVMIHDLSTTGMLVETRAPLEPFDALEIDLPRVGSVPALVVWNSGKYFGCQFKEPISRGAISAALLRSPAVVPIDAAQVRPPISLPEAVPLQEPSGHFEPDVSDDEKAPLSVRLRVILGSAIFLWILIIWTIIGLTKFIRAMSD